MENIKKITKLLIAAAAVTVVAAATHFDIPKASVERAAAEPQSSCEPIPADENLCGDTPADIVESAQAWCDTYSPYSYGAGGAGGPGSAVDCSAFTRSLYEELGIEIPRVSYDQAEAGEKVAYTPGDCSNLLPGDLIIMNDYGHCGIYAGNGMVIHASSAGGKVIKVPLSSFSDGFVNEVRRIIPNESSESSG